MRTRSFLFAFVLTVILAVNGYGTTLISDDFDDGDLGINNGIGSGFDTVGTDTVTESSGAAVFAPYQSSGTTVITSKDSFDPFQASLTTRTEWSIESVTDNSKRAWVGLRDASSSHNHFIPWTPVGQGLYISIFQHSSDIIYPPNFPAEGNLVAQDAAGNKTFLASWNWTSYTGSALDITFDTTATTYDLSFSELVNLVSGNLSGTITGLGTPAAAFEVGAHQQWDGYTLEIDSITVTAIPEPTTIFLIGFGILGLLGVVIRQRRRKK